MALSSMTGFARGHGVCGPYAWAWEVKSVNGKGLDLRLRLPPGWDAIEVPVRARAAETLARGSIQANLTVERTGVQPVVRVNTAVLEAVLATVRQL
ncbi:MAG TPA: YicC/YloC family endoribonuclease, partial [Xanthobacteraceae bacterium]|nr:YicC/YloC family endoribonuclease [Xanthobacteraceae bacterium]